MPSLRPLLVFLLCCLSLADALHAEVLITEVIPNVTTTATRGDVVELFNTGPGAVDLTDWVLTDLDDDPVGGVLQDATFAPGSLGLAPLQAGEFAVVDFVDSAGTASWQTTNYGMRIVAPLQAGSFLGSERDELLLADANHTPLDFVAWADSGTIVPPNSYDDLSAVTGAVFDYGLIPGNAAWLGAEAIASDADYYASAVDFTAFAPVSTWGGGAIRRLSTNGVFDVGSPDGAAQWEAVPRHQATLGNASDDVAAGMGLRPIRVTDDLAEWLGQIETTTFPDRRIARFPDQNDFMTAGAMERADFTGVLALAMAASWEDAFAAADAIGYEVVEFLDTVSGETFHLLRERFVPGEVGFTGRGVFAFYSGTGVRDDLVIEIPHPVFDSNTLEEGALALPSVRPRVLAIAGTHRNNRVNESTCDGMLDGDNFRISDVAHHPDNFFHAAHVWLLDNLADMRAIQFHGFCCPGAGDYANLSDDLVMTNGFDAAPAVSDFGRTWSERIEAQGFLADGVDLSTVAIFPEDTDHLGGTDNLQGRVSNGVTVGMECNSPALAASGRFHQLEQDPDVREEPQHVIDALIEALDLVDDLAACPAMPAIGCRAPGKSVALVVDKEGSLKDRFVWKWLKGEATDLADFSDALNGAADYRVCVYDASPAPQPLVDLGTAAGGTCDGAPCWKATGSKGYRFKDKAGTPGDLFLLKLKSGDAGKAKLIAKASRGNLTAPALPLTLPVVAQLLIDDGVSPQCWQSTFTQPPVKNDAAKFKAVE